MPAAISATPTDHTDDEGDHAETAEAVVAAMIPRMSGARESPHAPMTTNTSSPVRKVCPGTVLNGLSPGAATGVTRSADDTAETA
jgi:hypothetical protein